jgi:hypothetical protein
LYDDPFDIRVLTSPNYRNVPNLSFFKLEKVLAKFTLEDARYVARRFREALDDASVVYGTASRCYVSHLGRS